MPRKQQGWITFQSSEEERQILEQICQQTQRTKTEVLRELVRNLDHSPASPQLSSIPEPEEDATAEVLEQPSTLPAVKISARNILKAKIKRLVMGSINAEVLLEIAPGVHLVSVITKTSAEQLDLTEGKDVYAVVKSNNVMIAEEQS